MLSGLSRRRVECLLLTLGLPIFLTLATNPRLALVVLFVVVVLAVRWLHYQPGFSWDAEWNRAALTPAVLRRIVLLAGVAAVGLVLLLRAYNPVLVFQFIREQPQFFAVVAICYPVLSVVPQEILYRSFYRRRYGAVLSSEAAFLVANGIAFGAAHLVFDNAVAPLLSTLGGILFAWRYERTRSLAVVTLEHSLYGLLVFATGWGVYFYHGGGAVLAAMGQ